MQAACQLQYICLYHLLYDHVTLCYKQFGDYDWKDLVEERKLDTLFVYELDKYLTAYKLQVHTVRETRWTKSKLLSTIINTKRSVNLHQSRSSSVMLMVIVMALPSCLRVSTVQRFGWDPVSESTWFVYFWFQRPSLIQIFILADWSWLIQCSKQQCKWFLLFSWLLCVAQHKHNTLNTNSAKSFNNNINKDYVYIYFKGITVCNYSTRKLDGWICNLTV